MARISTYAIDGTLASSDKLIGTDSSGTITKNYPLGSVSDWLKESGASAVLGQNNYTFQITADPDTGRLPGTISFDNYGGDGTAFSNITTFRLSKISSTGKNVANYLLSTVGDKVILGQLDDLNNFGVYTLVSLTQNSSETGFYDAALLFVEGNGALVGNGIYGLATHSASESAVWGNIEGTVTNQTDLVNYIDAEIAAIPAPATPTLQTVTDEGNTTNNPISTGTITANNELHFVNSAMRIFRSDNDMRLRTNNSDRVAITSAGNVGIGTTTPSAKLHIATSTTGGAASAILQDNNRTGTGALNYLALVDSAAATQAKIGYLSTLNGELSFSNLIGSTTVSSTGQTTISAATNVLFNTSGSTKLKITNTGNVGIGTTSPTKKLHVNGDAFFQNTVSLPDNAYIGLGTGFDFHLLHNGSSSSITNSTGNLNILSNGGDAVFSTASTERLRITSTGNVGIGTTSPETKLSVAGGKIQLENYQEITWSDIGDGNTGRVSIRGSEDDDFILFRTDNAERMRIHTNGNVGIGTTSPGVPLDVTGVIRTTTSFVGNASIVNQVTAATSSGSIKFKNHSGVDRAIITDAGNVGIGTTSPTRKLDVAGDMNLASSAVALRIGGTAVLGVLNGLTRVNGTGGASGGIAFTPNNDNNEKMRITNAGNVGIGTSSPSQKLEVAGNVIINDSGSGKVYLGDTNNYLGIISSNLYSVSSGQTIFYTNSAERMRITTAGNVGIGTTSPGSKLTVVGRVDFQNDLRLRGTDSAANQGVTRLFVDNSNKLHIDTANNGSNLFVIDSSGKVGIGTTSPGTKLQLKGNSTYITVNNNSNHNSVQVGSDSSGDGALFLRDSSGNNKIYLSGESNTNNYINSGNVGIGTTSPDAMLHIKGSASSTEVKIDTNNNSISDSAFIKFNASRAQVGWIDSAVTLTDGGGNKDIKLKVNTGSIFLQTNNTNRLTIANGGNVGIGTVSPSEKLEVAGIIKTVHTDNAYTKLRGTGLYFSRSNSYLIAETNNSLSLNIGDSTSRWANTRINSAFVKFENGSTENMRITSAGNVGVGTTAPNSKVHINGTAMEQLRMETSGGPGSSGATNGRVGDMAYDDDYFYIKTANGWGRMALDFAF